MQIIHAYKAVSYICILAGEALLLRKTPSLATELSNIFIYITKP